MTFRVGQKVVCVNKGRYGRLWGNRDARIGQIYTISSVTICPDKHRLGVRLKEIKLPLNLTLMERMAFEASRFRKVVKRKTARKSAAKKKTKTDISFAHEIVRKVFDGVRA